MDNAGPENITGCDQDFDLQRIAASDNQINIKGVIA